MQVTDAKELRDAEMVCDRREKKQEEYAMNKPYALTLFGLLLSDGCLSLVVSP
jgi:hypothetical protein